MSIEQRAHEAAMAHATSMGHAGSDDFVNAYIHVYGRVVGESKKIVDEKTPEEFLELERKMHQEILDEQVKILDKFYGDWAPKKQPWWKLW